jgi:enterochelin esterase-like enzyme
MTKKTKILLFGLFYLAMILFLAGCGLISRSQSSSISEVVQQTIEAISTRFTPIVPTDTQTPPSTTTPTATMSPSPSPTMQSTQCTRVTGSIEYREIILSGINQPLAFRVYLPPCYDVDTDLTYPVLYLLHGQSQTDEQWDRLGADEIADRLIAYGDAPHFMIVMPWETNNLVDPALSSFGEELVNDLIPWIDEEYRTCNTRECRAIGGISRGAGWAMRLGLTRWDLFGSIGAHSFAPFSGDFYNAPYWFKEIPEDQFPRIYIDLGATDDLVTVAGLFEDRLTKYLVAHEWVINKGTHNEIYWAAHVEDYLYWYTFPWKKLDFELQIERLTPTPNSETLE